MNFLQILDKYCPAELVSIVGIIRWVIRLICFVIPVILIVLCIMDIAKIVTAGNIDDKLKKEVTGRISTRIIFAVIIFLVPTIIRLLFNFIPVKDATLVDGTNTSSWADCWDLAADYNKSSTNLPGE